MELQRKANSQVSYLTVFINAQRLQTQRLANLEKVVRREEEQREQLNTKKIESIMNRALESRDSTIQRIQERRISIIRKLAKQRDHVNGVKEKRDIIDDFANFGSRVYAPLAREGRRADAMILQDIKPPSLETHQAVGDLEKSARLLPLDSTESETALLASQTSLQKQDLQLSVQLEELASSLKQKRKEKLPKPSVAEKIEKPPPRPPTPRVYVPSQDEEELEASIIFLQRLVRGRAIQNLMFEGKQRRAELIHELKKTMVDTAPRSQATQTRNEKVDTEEDIWITTALDDMLGSIVGNALDFFSKELVRVNEERKIAAMVEVAERTRRMREAEESGRRQAEQQARQREDEIFLQIMSTHFQTASTFVEQILADAEHASTFNFQNVFSVIQSINEERSWMHALPEWKRRDSQA